MWYEDGCKNCKKPVIAETRSKDFEKILSLIPLDEPKREQLARLILDGSSTHLAKAKLGIGYAKKASLVYKTLSKIDTVKS